MIRVIPAIDMIDGRCVRLTQGDFERVSRYDPSPLEVARRYADAGFPALHLIDLDAARSGRTAGLRVLESIASATGAAIQFGGGIHGEGDLRAAFEAGAARVIAGSVAVNDRGRVIDWLARFGPDRVVIGADARDGSVRVDAWRRDAGVDVVDFVRDYVRVGARWTLATDIDRDGAMAGPSLPLYRKLRAAAPSMRLIASGGVRNAGDVRDLDRAGVDAVVIGKALLEGAVTLDDLREFAC